PLEAIPRNDQGGRVSNRFRPLSAGEPDQLRAKHSRDPTSRSSSKASWRVRIRSTGRILPAPAWYLAGGTSGTQTHRRQARASLFVRLSTTLSCVYFLNYRLTAIHLSR